MALTSHESIGPHFESESPVTRPPDRREVTLPRGFVESVGEELSHDFAGTRFFESSGPARLGARAFARRDEVHFAKGQFDPGSRGGRQMIGHEMAHLAQQHRRAVPTTHRAGAIAINDDPSLESEADRMGARAASAMHRPSARSLGSSPAGTSDSASAGGTAEATGATSAPVTSGGVAQMNGGGKGGSWKDWFKSKFSGPHHYDVWHPVMPEGSDSSDKVYSHLKKNPAPFVGPSSDEGSRLSIPLLGDVMSTSSPENRSVTNETMGNHLLSPGTVERTVESRNGMTGIRTVGDGTGLFPTMNNLMAHPLWGGMMAHSARLQLDPDYREAHERFRDQDHW